MAVSNTGGTKGLLTGRVGQTLYSIQKQADGASVQVVRSLPSSVAYSNTVKQAINRMCMGMVERAMAQFKDILVSSFEGSKSYEESCNRFSAANYPLVVEDLQRQVFFEDDIEDESYIELAAPEFRYYVKGRKYNLAGNWIVSQGSWPVNWRGEMAFGDYFSTKVLAKTAIVGVSPTYGRFLSANGWNQNSYITYVYVVRNNRAYSDQVYYVRLYLTAYATDDEVPTQFNYRRFFGVESNGRVSWSYNPTTGQVSFTLDWTNQSQLSDCVQWGYIISIKRGDVWRKSTCVLRFTRPYDSDQHHLTFARSVWSSWCPGVPFPNKWPKS